MISKGFYFSSKIEKNKGDRDFKYAYTKYNNNSSNYYVLICYNCFSKKAVLGRLDKT